MSSNLADRRIHRRGWRQRVVAAMVAGLPFATATGQKPPSPDAGKTKSAARVAVERRYVMAPDASIRVAGAISNLRIIGWDRDSLVITGSVPVGWRFDGGAAAPSAGFVAPARDAVALAFIAVGWIFWRERASIEVPNESGVLRGTTSATPETVPVSR